MRRAGVEPLLLVRGKEGYPPALERLGEAAPPLLTLFGNVRLLEQPSVGLFCSVRVPAGAMFAAYDVARELADSGSTVAGGFQSPMEREVLRYLLAGNTSVILCPARGMEALRLPAAWEPAMNEARLLVLSAFPPRVDRPTLETSALRNRVVAALAGRVLILHASAGGRLARLAAEAVGRGIPVHCIDHPANDDLRLLGAEPLP